MSLPAVPAGMPGKATVKRILSPDEWRKKQLDTLRAVGEANYKIGIASPKKDPIAAGIAAEDKWADRVRKAIEENLTKRIESFKLLRLFLSAQICRFGLKSKSLKSLNNIIKRG